MTHPAYSLRPTAYSLQPAFDQRQVVEKILRHLGLWNGTPLVAPARAPPDADTGPWTREPCADVDPMPDYENVLTDFEDQLPARALFFAAPADGAPVGCARSGHQTPPISPAATSGGGLRAAARGRTWPCAGKPVKM